MTSLNETFYPKEFIVDEAFSHVRNQECHSQQRKLNVSRIHDEFFILKQRLRFRDYCRSSKDALGSPTKKLNK